MEPNQPYQGFAPSAYGAAPAYVPQQAAPPQQLRPLSTGEILDRTLALYRRHFWLFAGIGAGPAMVSTLTSAIRLLFTHGTNPFFTRMGSSDPVVTQQIFASYIKMQVYTLPVLLLFLVAYGISKAATVRAVMDATHGVAPTAAEAYRGVAGRWLRWSGIVLRQYWALVWPICAGGSLWLGSAIGGALLMKGNQLAIGVTALLTFLLFLAGFVLGVMNYLRTTLAEAAGVVENIGVNAAMKRSRALTKGSKGRIFLAILLVYALYMVAGGLQLPFVIIAGTARGAAHVLLLVGALVVGFVATSLVLPVASIALTLFYVDERVRREGYDIELLLQRSAATQGPPEL